MTKLLDTSVVVDIDRGGVDERVAKLDDEGRHAISAVTVTELRLGANKLHEPGSDAHEAAVDGLERLIARFDVLPVTQPIAGAAADVIHDLQQRGVSLNDLHDVYISATGQVERLPIVTANVSHFDRIEDVRVIDWTSY